MGPRGTEGVPGVAEPSGGRRAPTAPAWSGCCQYREPLPSRKWGGGVAVQRSLEGKY